VLWAISHDEGSGKARLWIGLSEENIRRLRNDEPIVKPLEKELSGWELVIMGPEDLVRFCAKTGTPLPPDMNE
jgi:hypothetical protein